MGGEGSATTPELSSQTETGKHLQRGRERRIGCGCYNVTDTEQNCIYFKSAVQGGEGLPPVRMVIGAAGEFSDLQDGQQVSKILSPSPIFAPFLGKLCKFNSQNVFFFFLVLKTLLLSFL